ncbi:MaoC/PaaZ C-terminal domain-containing protein [Ramlibacter albus]|uniref:MaoC family dehydratase N-terminal domain-containing protein n=1 Tax=Ramlibacter albus TaxID=2079448 RepID=A0A923MAQ0_9BURK|nr:MaoC/PaaZ C-terminal domain-containing protein [Ramlibacter albus]MBC5765617.1 MaoC family dehydratase N-terminal domain-containing protein [Ramlibacter albus]
MDTTPQPAADTGRQLPAGEYAFDQLEPGDWYETAGVTVTEAHIVGFAGLTGDLFDVHMDEQFAREAGFPGRIAHGLLGLAMADGLKTRCSVRLLGIATLGWNWSFRAALLPNDRIHARLWVVAKRTTRRGDRGIVTLGMRVVNQRGETIQDGETQLLIRMSAAGH